MTRQVGTMTGRCNCAPGHTNLTLSHTSRPVHVNIVVFSIRAPFVRVILSTTQHRTHHLTTFDIRIVFQLSPSLSPIRRISVVRRLIRRRRVDTLTVAPLSYLLIRAGVGRLVSRHKVPIIAFGASLPGVHQLYCIKRRGLSSNHAITRLVHLIAQRDNAIIAVDSS